METTQTTTRVGYDIILGNKAQEMYEELKKSESAEESLTAIFQIFKALTRESFKSGIEVGKREMRQRRNPIN